VAERTLPVLNLYRGVKYHEPEYWKFGEAGNKYFRHATGQLYAISKDLATYISVNRLVFELPCLVPVCKLFSNGTLPY